MKKLLLFDIDGTMLQTHGVGRRAVERAVGTHLGRPVDTSGIRFSGKTDPQIMLEVLTAEGFTDDASTAVLDQLNEAYQAILQETLVPEKVEVLPGVPQLIHHLAAEPDIQLAVLTGNLEPMAYLKLRAVGLADYFPFGAFGSDSPHRDDLPAIAIDRARQHTGHSFSGRDVIVIGDTEHDIRCGAGAGATCVGVCTGHYTRADLEPHSPHIILEDLSDLHAFQKQVLNS